MDKQFRFDAPRVLVQANLARITRLAVESDGGIAMAFRIGDAAAFERAETKDVKLGAATLSPATQAAVAALFANAYNELVAAGHLPAGAEEPVPEPTKEAVAAEAVVREGGR